MRLRDYLKAYDITDAEFARRIDVTRQAVYHYTATGRVPDWPILERIARATHGAVMPNDFLPPSKRNGRGA